MYVCFLFVWRIALCAPDKPLQQCLPPSAARIRGMCHPACVLLPFWSCGKPLWPQRRKGFICLIIPSHILSLRDLKTGAQGENQGAGWPAFPYCSGSSHRPPFTAKEACQGPGGCCWLAGRQSPARPAFFCVWMRITRWGTMPPTMNQALPHQLIFETIFHRYAHRPTWQRQWLNWGSVSRWL